MPLSALRLALGEHSQAEWSRAYTIPPSSAPDLPRDRLKCVTERLRPLPRLPSWPLSLRAGRKTARCSFAHACTDPGTDRECEPAAARCPVREWDRSRCENCRASVHPQGAMPIRSVGRRSSPSPRSGHAPAASEYNAAQAQPVQGLFYTRCTEPKGHRSFSLRHFPAIVMAGQSWFCPWILSARKWARSIGDWAE